MISSWMSEMHAKAMRERLKMEEERRQSQQAKKREEGMKVEWSEPSILEGMNEHRKAVEGEEIQIMYFDEASTIKDWCEPKEQDQDPNYVQLREVLHEAYKQAAEGKGKTRHGGDKPFEDQIIVLSGKLLDGSIDFHAGQIMKKAEEAARMLKAGNTPGAIQEMYGIICYAAAAVIVMENEG